MIAYLSSHQAKGKGNRINNIFIRGDSATPNTTADAPSAYRQSLERLTNLPEQKRLAVQPVREEISQANP